MGQRLGQFARIGLILVITMFMTVQAQAAPYAAMVIDARTGEVLHSRNADTRLHPASLTKMMTLYIAFQAIEHGEITLDTVVTISANAASEPPSKLGLRAGQKIKLRYLIRAAAVKSANDAATAIGEAISGSEAAFARRMNRTAQALGMSRTTFKNANGLTEEGHLSTARDMTTLGRHIFYDYPEYYNLFSRRSTDAGGTAVYNTNRRFLDAYEGADGIKTGYTRAAGFNLVASAQHGQERIIATVFGGASTAARNAKVAELLDLGFQRAPSRATVRAPAKPAYEGNTGGAGKTIRVVLAVPTSPFPRYRPVAQPDEALIASIEEEVDQTIAAVIETAVEEEPEAPEVAPEVLIAAAATPPPSRPEVAEETVALVDEVVAEVVVAEETAEAAPVTVEVAEAEAEPATEAAPETAVALLAEAEEPSVGPAPAPAPSRPDVILAAVEKAADPVTDAPEIVTRLSTSGGRHWGINLGRYPTEFEAERILLRTALAELSTLGEALRKVVRSRQGFDANFVGLTQEGADLACRRLQARNTECTVMGPS